MRTFSILLLGFCVAIAGRSAELRHVVLVHGIHDSGAGMKAMAGCLSGKGYSVHILPYEPSDGSVGLDVLADQFASYADRELAHVPKFDVIAFSMGGLVARCYIQNLGGARRTGKFIKISTPNHGTLDAYLLWNAAGRQMRPGSRFLNALNASLGCYRGIPCATVRTPFDLVVIPSRSSEMAFAKNLEAPVLFHPFMVSDQEVNGKVLAFLARTEPRK